MIAYVEIPVRGNYINCEANGWGKSFTKKCHGQVELNNFKNLAAKHIILDKIKGFVKSRSIAFEMMHYQDKWKWDNIKFFEYYIPTKENKPSAIVFEFVMKHELKLLSLLPGKPNNQTKDILEIIAFCKFQFKQLCDK